MSGANKTQMGGSNPISVKLENPLKCDDLGCIVNSIITALYYIAIAVVPLMIVVGAFQILTAAGNPERVTAGRNTITYAVIGFAVILLSRGFIYIIKELLEVK